MHTILGTKGLSLAIIHFPELDMTEVRQMRIYAMKCVEAKVNSTVFHHTTQF